MTTASDSVKTPLRYLTVQDVIWINTQLTRQVRAFGYLKLEEAVYYQYSYGSVQGVVPQAARFLAGFARLQPFDKGNAATGFVGCAAFLMNNGLVLNRSDDEAAAWVEGFLSSSDPAAALQEAVESDPNFHPGITPNVAETVESVIGRYPGTIEALLEKG